MCMYVCMYLCMYVCTHTRMQVWALLQDVLRMSNERGWSFDNLYGKSLDLKVSRLVRLLDTPKCHVKSTCICIYMHIYICIYIYIYDTDTHVCVDRYFSVNFPLVEMLGGVL